LKLVYRLKGYRHRALYVNLHFDKVALNKRVFQKLLSEGASFFA
jgi:hypothetical protein